MRLVGQSRFVGLSFVRRVALLILLQCPGVICVVQAAEARAAVLTVADAIGPATQDYIARSFAQAKASDAQLIIIRMDTPGGLDGAMRDIIQIITGSSIPVATYVSPTGARAASAGTYILYASHVAAMAPGTNLGAATPVQIGGISFPGTDKPPSEQPPSEQPEPEKKSSKRPDAENKTDGSDRSQNGAEDAQTDKVTDERVGQRVKQGDAMQHKMINDASAYIRGLAELHGRNAEWAEQAVREAASLPAREALKLNVIDIVASDIEDLLAQIDGREALVQGVKQTLHTQGLSTFDIVPDWRNRLLSVITNPNVAYILMMLGIYGLILEFYNPGGLVPGTVGAICLVLAMYSFQLLPVNYAGIALILLGVGLMVAEAFQPSFGMLGIGGVTAFVIGSIILMDTDVPDFKIYLSVVASFAAATLLVFFFVIGMAVRARGKPVVSGAEELIGMTATVTQPLDAHQAYVRVHGELWRAQAGTPLRKGQQLRVTAIDGLTLEVEPLPVVTATTGTTDSSFAEQNP